MSTVCSIATNMDAADLRGFKKNQCYFMMLGIAATVKKKKLKFLMNSLEKCFLQSVQCCTANWKQKS